MPTLVEDPLRKNVGLRTGSPSAGSTVTYAQQPGAPRAGQQSAHALVRASTSRGPARIEKAAALCLCGDCRPAGAPPGASKTIAKSMVLRGELRSFCELRAPAHSPRPAWYCKPPKAGGYRFRGLPLNMHAHQLDNANLVITKEA